MNLPSGPHFLILAFAESDIFFRASRDAFLPLFQPPIMRPPAALRANRSGVLTTRETISERCFLYSSVRIFPLFPAPILARCSALFGLPLAETDILALDSA